METIGLIAAMPQESEALLGIIRGGKRIEVGSLRGVHFQSAYRDCVMVTSGMGSRRAAGAARSLIKTLHPACLVSFGIAGAVQEDLKIGDVIMATTSCALEKGILSPLQPLTSLSDSACKAVEQALHSRSVRLLLGTAVTTRGSQMIMQQPQELLNPILEMETTGILQVTTKSGIPLVVLRSVSDNPQNPIPFNLETVMDDDNNLRPGQLLLAFINHPRLLLQTRQIFKNSRIAANNAAIAVAAALGQGLPMVDSPI